MPGRFVYPAVYIMASRPLGVLYVGSTNDLARRVWEHREAVQPGFTRDHGCALLVWCEPHDLMTEAIRRELAIKHWRRTWKLELVEATNSEWRDLYADLV